MSETITEEYRRQQVELHKNPKYGVVSLKFVPIVAELIRKYSFKSVSDYGAGKQNLLRGLTESGVRNIQYFPYDPAFPEYGQPRTADIVCCIDVLEHIEPPLLDNVLMQLQGLVSKIGLFSIHTGPANKVLPDGRNAHLIQQPNSWWLKRISDYFEVRHLQTLPDTGGFWMIVEAKANSAQNTAAPATV